MAKIDAMLGNEPPEPRAPKCIFLHEYIVRWSPPGWQSLISITARMLSSLQQRLAKRPAPAPSIDDLRPCFACAPPGEGISTPLFTLCSVEASSTPLCDGTASAASPRPRLFGCTSAWPLLSAALGCPKMALIKRCRAAVAVETPSEARVQPVELWLHEASALECREHLP